MGWCCERAGGVEILCGERTIGGKKVKLVPDSYTPKSSDFPSNDLALMACMQKTSNCGTRNNTIEKASDSVTLKGTGLSKSETCSWIVQVKCGLPKVTVDSLPASMSDANTKITYVEWQNSLLENVKEGQWAPHASTIIPKKFYQAKEEIGTLEDVRFEDTIYSISTVVEEIEKQNKLVRSYISESLSYLSKVSAYNDATELVFAQMIVWDTYNWFDRLFTSEEDVITAKLPSKPSLPSQPVPSAFPDLNDLDFYKGGAGFPISGEIDISSAFKGTTKYFGVFGQTSTAGDFGFTSVVDEKDKCHPRYVALNVNVYDDTGVSASDEVSITVSVQKNVAA